MQTIRWLLHASLCLFVLTSLLLHSSDGARPSPPGDMLGRPTAAASPVGVGFRSVPTEELVVDTGIIAAGAVSDADVAARPPPPAPVATTPAAAVGNRRGRGGDDVLLRRGRSVALVAQLLMRHSAARGVLAAEAAAATDGSGPSCHSNNMHITCSPPSQN